MQKSRECPVCKMDIDPLRHHTCQKRVLRSKGESIPRELFSRPENPEEEFSEAERLNAGLEVLGQDEGYLG